MRALELSSKRTLSIVEKPLRALNSGELRVKTLFAGVSFTDLIIQKGFYKYQKEYMPTPYTPGFEAVGIVTEVCGASDIHVGDKVAILRRSGCFAEEITTNESEVIALPTDADLEWVCSLLVNFFTAFHALHNIVVIQPGSNELPRPKGTRYHWLNKVGCA